MAKYISLGRFNKKYFFILGSIIVRIIVTFISGFTPYLTPNNPIFIFGFNSNFFSHPIVSYCFQYISLCIGGIILEFVFRKNNESNTRSSNILSKYINPTAIPDKYKFKDDEEIKSSDKKNFLRIFSVFSLYYFAKVAMLSLDNLGYNRVKYWPLEFIFLYIFSKKILNRILYRHQKLSLSTLLIFCTTVYIINSFIPQSNRNCSSLSGEELKECKILSVNIYNDIIDKFGGFFIPIIILIYLAAMVSNAYSSIKIKWFADIKYITLSRILIYLGVIGLFYSLILLFIFSNMACSKEINNILSYVCKLEYQGELFYENYKTFSAIEYNKKFYIDTFIEIPLFIISSFLSIFFELLIIKDLDPFYLIPIDCLYFLIYDIIDYCINYPITNLYRNLKFTCQVCSNTVAVFLCCIYFEIFELHFCSLDKYLRRFIIKRGQEEKKYILKEINELSDLEGVLENDELNDSLHAYKHSFRNTKN